MKCPSCGREEWTPTTPCPECGFSGPLAQIEELGHIRYLLDALTEWQEAPLRARKKLWARYQRRLRGLEIELGLRLPPLSPEEARDAVKEVLRLQRLFPLLNLWRERDWIRPDAADALAERTRRRIEELRTRLAEVGSPQVPAAYLPAERIARLKSLRDVLDELHEGKAWVDEAAYQAAVADLERWVEQMETRPGMRRPPKKEKPPPLAGIRPPRAPEKPPPPAAPEKPPPPAAPEKPPPPTAPPREPFTWGRLWRSLLSERTLHVLLFVGVFLFFASAVTLVVYNWERLHPLVALVMGVGFTSLFYGLGWYVRAKMGLRQSGFALLAIGALLVPMDFCVVYLSGDIFPPEAWGEVLLLGSAVCLAAYSATAVLLRIEFFGYLVGAAAGSLLCAALRVAGAPNDWWTAALCGLSLLLMLSVRWLERRPEGSRLRVLERPFRHLALLIATCTLLVATGLRIANQITRNSFRLALALGWWLACATYIVAAARWPRRLFASAACIAAPAAFYLTLEPFLVPADTGWYALGWALLTPAYLALARVLQRRPEDKGRRAQGRTTFAWAILLVILAAAWSLGNMSAAAATHAVLAGSVILAVVLWRRPALLLVASLFSLSATTTWMATRGLDLAQYSLGWATVAILHVAAATLLRRTERYTTPLYAAGLGAAVLSLLPPLVAFDRYVLTYALGNWIALAGWIAWLAHGEKHPGLHRLLRMAGPLRRSIPHWAAALPLPIWFWLAWTGHVRPADAWLGVGFAGLAWACLGLGRRLARHDESYSLPWYAASLICSAVGPVVAEGYGDQLLLAGTLLNGAVLYFLYAYLFRWRWWLLVGGLTLPFGYGLALDHLGLPLDPLKASLALVPAAYTLVSIWLERRRRVPAGFLVPLRGAAHAVAAVALLWGFSGLRDQLVRNVAWADSARLWAAGGQLVLGVTYGAVAWHLEKERWGHVASWLGVSAGVLAATAYGQGRGSTALKIALLATVYVGIERALHALRERHPLPHKVWSLYRRPLLVAGWALSGGAVALALLGNLWLLGGGPVRVDWAIAALLAVVALYTGSARLFRQPTEPVRPLLLWLAAPLLVAPWTLLTYRGWYVWASPLAPRYALAWAVLAWVLLTIGLALDGLAGRRYGLPLRTTAHVLLPFSLAWGVADASVSSGTCGLGVAFYTLAAVVDHRRGRKGLGAARFLYPAALLIPVWAVYLLAWQGPWLPHLFHGLLLLVLSVPLFVAARQLRRVDAADALPAYLASYGSAIAGTMLVSYEYPLLALALLFDAGLALVSARLTRGPLWVYPAVALPPVALLLALAEFGFDPARHGWWLIGLGAVYLAQAWALRRLSAHRYATPLMVAAYTIVTLGLSISSYEQTAAFWAYGAAALTYALSAAWLRQPLLLTPAAALAVVPYGIALDRTAWIAPADHGLALWPGIVVALLVAHLLDRYLGAPRGFPWGQPGRWLPEAARRLTEWWGLPLYALGYVLALAGVALSSAHPDRLALALALTAIAYGLATVRFRLRGWLLAAIAAAQAAALAFIWTAAWGLLGLPEAWVARLGHPAWQALAFLPVSLATAAAGLWIERKRGEGSPLAGPRPVWEGWSRPLYWLLALDLLVVQAISISRAQPGTLVSLVHVLLLAALALIWTQPILTYLAAGLGLVAVLQRLAWVEAPGIDAPWAVALLALGYGLIGFGLEYARRRERWNLPKRLAVLERPLEWAGLATSWIAISLMVGEGIEIWRWLFRSLFLGLPAMAAEDVAVVQMAVVVLALAGLLYLAAALVRRWLRRGYGAVALLVCAWSLEWFLVWNRREVQWYAIPAGLYLLGVGYLEWRQGHKRLACWIDRAALLLLLGTSFYQSLTTEYGWTYALLMGAESLLLIWMGSARRQRRFLYFGVVGVVTDVGAQLVNPLLSANRWIVLGGAGLLVIALAILVERSLKTVKRLSQKWRERLEEWE